MSLGLGPASVSRSHVVWTIRLMGSREFSPEPRKELAAARE